jgi:hypothetical protein
MAMRLRMMFGAILLTAMAAGAEAQPGPRHSGLNVALGVAQGKLKTSCNVCSLPDKEGGLSAVGHLGWTLHDRVILIGDMLFYQKQQLDINQDKANTDYLLATAGLILYPSPRWDTFIKVGAGIGKLSQTLATDLGIRKVDVTGPAIRIGGGTDLQLGRSWRLSPFIEYVIGIASDTNVDGVKTKTNLLAFGAAVTWP